MLNKMHKATVHADRFEEYLPSRSTCAFLGVFSSFHMYMIRYGLGLDISVEVASAWLAVTAVLCLLSFKSVRFIVSGKIFRV